MSQTRFPRRWRTYGAFTIVEESKLSLARRSSLCALRCGLIAGHVGRAPMAQRRGLPHVYVIMVGGSDQLVSDGSCLVVDPQGSVVASACSFDEDLVLFARETFAGDQHERHVNETSSGYSALIPGFPDPSKAAGTDKEKLAVFRKVRDDIRKRFHEYDETEIKKGR